MSTSCSCLKICSVFVALGNVGLGLYIFIEGAIILKEFLATRIIAIGLIIVYFQLSIFLLFVGVLLLLGIFQEREKHISLYLLLSSLIWFIITMLVISYMLFYNTTAMTHYITSNETVTTTTTTPAPGPSPSPIPKETVPVQKAVGFSIGLVLIWCGQLGVYKYHDQVIEKNVIDAGESYVSSAMNS